MRKPALGDAQIARAKYSFVLMSAKFDQLHLKPILSEPILQLRFF